MTVIDAFPWARWHPSFGKRLQTNRARLCAFDRWHDLDQL